MPYRALVITAFIICSLQARAGGIFEDIFISSFEVDSTCWTLGELSDPINIQAVSISGDLTLNGQPFPQSEYDDALFYLRNVGTGDDILLGNSHDNNYSIRVTAGYYDVIYRSETPGDNTPGNDATVVMKHVELLADRTLDINVVAHRISGAFKLNGGAFPASNYDHGDFVLVGKQGGQVTIGDSKDQTFSDVMVIQGDYTVRFQASQTTLAPANLNGFVETLSLGADANSLVFDVPSIELSGTFRHNGELWPVTEYEDGLFYLETADGDQVFLENSHFNEFSKQVIPGVYDVYWQLQTPDSSIPVNNRAKIASNVDVSGGTLNINVISYLISGNFTLNGEAFPGSVTQTGRVVLRDKASGDESTIGLTNEGSYQQRIIAGTYETLYQHYLGILVPQNRNAVLDSDLLINNNGVRNFNLSSSIFYSTPFNNDQLFYDSIFERGNIYLRNPLTGDEVLLGLTSQQSFTTRIATGTYDAYYSHVNGNLVPQNKMGLVKKNIVIGPAPAPAPSQPQGVVPYPINVNSVVVTGDFQLNGNDTPDSENDDGLISLKYNEDSVLLGNSHFHSYSKRVLISDYWVHYGVQTPGPVMPYNNDSRLNCARLAPSND